MSNWKPSSKQGTRNDPGFGKNGRQPFSIYVNIEGVVVEVQLSLYNKDRSVGNTIGGLPDGPHKGHGLPIQTTFRFLRPGSWKPREWYLDRCDLPNEAI